MGNYVALRSSVITTKWPGVCLNEVFEPELIKCTRDLR